MAHRTRFQEFLNDFPVETSQIINKERENKEIHHDIIEIFIFQRGSITKKTADIWIAKISKLFDYVRISCSLKDNTSYVILPDEFDIEKFKKWDQISHLQRFERLMFLKSTWAFECIRTQTIPVFEIHAHPFISWEKLFQGGYSACGTDTDTHGIQTRKCQLAIVNTESMSSLPPPKVQDLTNSPKRTLHGNRNGKRIYRPYDGDKDSQDRETSVPLFSPNKPGFACVRSGTRAGDGKKADENKNKHITSVLDQLQEIYELEGDQWRANSYKKASSMLSRMKRITDSDELKAIRGIGDSIRDKIQEIIQTGTLQKLQAFQSNEAVTLRIAFAKIWGVGPATAHQLVNKGYKSIEDLRRRGDSDLNSQQRIGLNRYEDLQLRIPREEVQEIEQFVIKHLQRIDPGTEGVVCGSYRRGKLSSGDVDILIYATDGRETIDVLPELVQSLSSIGFLTDHLSLPSDRRDDQGIATYMGVCRLSHEGSHYRRIDLKCYPRSCLAFALLYFTGSDHFNRSMRLYANRMGYTLSDQGLYPCGRDQKRVKTWKGSVIPCYTEKDVFDALALEYKSPTERNCLDTGNMIEEVNDEENKYDSESPRDSEL